MTMTSALLWGLGAGLGLMTATWLLQIATRNAGWVDVAWSYLLGGLGVFYAVASDGSTTSRWLTGLMAGFWGLRLGTYLFRRVASNAEDGRYTRLREWFGAWEQPGLLGFFWFQAAAASLLSLPFLAIAFRGDAPPTAAVALAVMIWVVAVGGESLADRQLARFKQDPANKGRVCDQGLWRYSRHPNYFCEWLHWLAYLPLAAGAPWGWTALISPVVMYWLLTRFTGVPATEAQTGRSRSQEYTDYIRRTNAFFPGPPKS